MIHIFISPLIVVELIPQFIHDICKHVRTRIVKCRRFLLIATFHYNNFEIS
eukprot:UN10264